MKLPDFLRSNELNSLRLRMGIPEGVLGSFDAKEPPPPPIVWEGPILKSRDGLPIKSLDDVRELPDSTLAYKDSRVLLYIRDVAVYPGRDSEPRFHVANCEVLKGMRRKNRFKKYVVSIRLDGQFNLNIIDSSRLRVEVRKLAVCQVCLDALKFDGFRLDMGRERRREIVRDFTIGSFFERYPCSLHPDLPPYNSTNAPTNDYDQDFSAKSNEFRRIASWTCQNPRCRVQLAKYPRFLHVHHVDGLKYNNNQENLRVLCIECHAGQPDHSHMKKLPDYADFTALKPRLPRATEAHS